MRGRACRARGGTDTRPLPEHQAPGRQAAARAHAGRGAQGRRASTAWWSPPTTPRVAEVAHAHGAEAPFLRPAELAADIPSLKPVIAHAVREIEAAGDRPDVVVVLQATTPFREARRHRRGRRRGWSTGGFDTVVSVDGGPHAQLARRGRRLLVPLFEQEGRREEQQPVYKENGAVVALRRAVARRAEPLRRAGRLPGARQARRLHRPRPRGLLDGGAPAAPAARALPRGRRRRPRHGPRLPLAGHRGRAARGCAARTSRS